MHIDVDSIFEREHQTDVVVTEKLLILEVIAAKKMQPFTAGLTGRWKQLESNDRAKSQGQMCPGYPTSIRQLFTQRHSWDEA